MLAAKYQTEVESSENLVLPLSLSLLSSRLTRVHMKPTWMKKTAEHSAGKVHFPEVEVFQRALIFHLAFFELKVGQEHRTSSSVLADYPDHSNRSVTCQFQQCDRNVSYIIIYCSHEVNSKTKMK